MPLHAACSAGRNCCFVQARFAFRSQNNSGNLHRGRRLIVRSAKAGMGLDPQVKDFLEQQNSSPVSYDSLTAEQARKNAKNILKPTKTFDVKSVTDAKTEGFKDIPVRWYTPETPFSAKPPVIVYFHGGGWVTGDIDLFDGLCRALVHHSGAHVASVGYGLAPEQPFPQGLEDAYAATCWAHQHAAKFGADPNQIAVAGDSAGGNFAAAVSILARDRAGPKLSLQLLLYPVVAYESDKTGLSESFKQNREGYYLTADKFEWYLKQYLSKPEQASDPRLSVTQTKDLSNLPAAAVITCEFDILKDQGKAYADKLQAAGVPVQYKDYPGQIHSFLGFAVTQYGTDTGVQALADVGQLIRRHFESSD